MQASALRTRSLWAPHAPSADESGLQSDDDAWDRFVATSATPSFLQATPWAAVKRANGWRAVRLVAASGRGPIGAQLLVRHLGRLPAGFGYAARGPISRAPLDPDTLFAFTRHLRDAAADVGASYVRIDPEVEDPDGSLALALRSLGWRPAREIQPTSTRVLDLAADEADLWQAIHRKWRQSIRKAGRGGPTVVAAEADRLGEFHAIHVETMHRVGLPARSEASFRALFEAFRDNGQAHLLFVEDPGGRPTATMLLLGWGDRVVDLYGGTTTVGRRTRANYLIKWEAIKRAKADGYRWYDLWGLPSERVSSFKAGWGGREVHYVGTWDLVIDPAGRWLFETALRVRARWLRLRRGRSAAHGLDAT